MTIGKSYWRQHSIIFAKNLLLSCLILSCQCCNFEYNNSKFKFREYIVQLEQQQEMLRRQVNAILILSKRSVLIDIFKHFQDETMDLMSDSMGNIRNMSEHIANELDEQAV